MLSLTASEETISDSARKVGQVTPDMRHKVSKEPLSELLELPGLHVRAYAKDSKTGEKFCIYSVNLEMK